MTEDHTPAGGSTGGHGASGATGPTSGATSGPTSGAVLHPDPAATFDENAHHMLQPRIRRVRGLQVPVRGPNGQVVPMLGLTDMQQISQRLVLTVPAMQRVLPLMDGTRTIGQIVNEIGPALKGDVLKQFIAQLDNAGLLTGPTFDRLRADMHDKFDASDLLPPGVTAQFGDRLVAQAHGREPTEAQKAEAPGLIRQQLDTWIDELFSKLPENADRAYDRMPRGLVSPQLDYGMGWVNYASAWGRFRGTGFRPDRIVILGTNNFGEGTGVTGCDKSFETPLGTVPLAADLHEALLGELGEEGSARYLRSRFDHEREHSVELQLPWIQHVFGLAPDEPGIPVLAALVHDPLFRNGESYDGNGLDLEPFVAALRSAIGRTGGTTLVVAAASLSHVGPQFGDQMPLAPVRDQQGNVRVTPEQAEQARNQVMQHDQQMLKMLAERRPDDLVGAMAWQKNPTRWSSIGAMVAAMKAVTPDEFKVLNHGAALDPQGMQMITTVSAAMF